MIAPLGAFAKPPQIFLDQKMTMRPQTEFELAACVRDAKGPLRIRGGGTRSGMATANGDNDLWTTGLSGVTLHEPGALTLVAGAGTPCAEIEATLAAQGQRLPFEVPDLRHLLGRDGQSTIGGVVAVNASGPRRVQAGACRDSLIGVRFVDGRGTVVKNGGRVMKNVTGYDLVKLLAGSWGTLGVLTEVSFKVLPIPEASLTLKVAGLSDADAVRAMAVALGSPYDVTGAAHQPDSGTFLRLEGFTTSVAYRAERLADLLAPFGPVTQLAAAPSALCWAGIRDVTPLAALAGDVWRISVKPSDAPRVVAAIGAPAHLLDWGGGLIWALMPQGVDLRTMMPPDVYGHASLVRGQGSAARPQFAPEPAPVAALTAGLRAQFDPRGILNPGLMGGRPLG